MLGRRELTNVVRLRYSRADRTQKSRIPDEFVASAGYSRKYAIGLLGGGCTLPPSYESLDPVVLKRDCDRLLRRLWDKHTVRFLADAPAPSKQENR